MTGRLCNNKRVNPVYVYQSCLVTAGLAAFMLPFTTKYWSLIVFSVIYGLSDGIYITTQNFILLTVVDSKRTTASFCINNVLYSFSAAAGGPVAGEFIISLQTERENCPGGAQAWGLDRKYSTFSVQRVRYKKAKKPFSSSSMAMNYNPTDEFHETWRS